MSAADHTLRELVWMAESKRKLCGHLAAWHVAMILARMPFTAVALDPAAINPFRDKSQSTPESTAMADLQRWKANRRWELTYKSGP